MRFTRKAREQKQKNWRMWKKGKQWLCGAALFFTVISSPGMLVLADEVNGGNSTAVTAGEVETPLPEGSTENEVEEVTEEDETSSTEAVAPSQQEENTPSTAGNNNETKAVEGKKERPKQGRIITQPTAISAIFPDAALAGYMRVRLGKSSVNDTVTQSQLDLVTTVSVVNKGIISLSGLEHLTNLETLDAAINEITDISALSGLTNISTLNLTANPISDISVLSGLTKLKDLGIGSVQVSDISALSNLPNLEKLGMGDIPAISDLGALSNLQSLKELQINNGYLSDVNALSGLLNLEKVSMSSNRTEISNVNLNNMPKLKNLSMDRCQISNAFSISNLPNLESINLNGNNISSISGISGLSSLRSLSLWSNNISDISGLSGLSSLRSLTLAENNISDISGLSEFSSLTSLNLDKNNISDVSALSGLTNLTDLHIASNQVSDISVLSGLTNQTALYANNQNITLSGIKWSNQLEIPFTIRDLDGYSWPNPYDGSRNELRLISISNGGEFANSIIKWTGLSNSNQTISYTWGGLGNTSVGFSGKTTIRIEPVGIKILVDSDGNSQTTGDQTLFAEETSNLDTLEDMYNFAKEQLNGTDYGLLSIAPNSDGDYVILVSRVGSLKKEDASGTAVGTDVPYTPTYTVTGTGNTAQLEVSYGVTVDAPPIGYVYIYGKGTAQEARSTASTSITIPLTDTNGNGTPQWQEDYTVKQYKKAGALHPSIPGGDQEVIGVPGDAVGGDIVTIPPGPITGS
ncbi:leucine-rich repeat domain-containing protein, partial [Listeria monocytogenes]|nr:leucine-rich repeat domain-containing protein [Listeria monocytogenes]